MFLGNNFIILFYDISSLSSSTVGADQIQQRVRLRHQELLHEGLRGRLHHRPPRHGRRSDGLWGDERGPRAEQPHAALCGSGKPYNYRKWIFIFLIVPDYSVVLYIQHIHTVDTVTFWKKQIFLFILEKLLQQLLSCYTKKVSYIGIHYTYISFYFTFIGTFCPIKPDITVPPELK